MRYYTTGEISTILSVSPRTVAKWIDSGELRGFTLPDCRERRVGRADLVNFTKARLTALPSELAEVLCVGVAANLLSDTSGVVRVSDLMEAGFRLATIIPSAVVLDTLTVGRTPEQLSHFLVTIRSLSPLSLKVAALVPEDWPPVPPPGFDAAVQHPISSNQFRELLRDLTS